MHFQLFSMLCVTFAWHELNKTGLSEKNNMPSENVCLVEESKQHSKYSNSSCIDTAENSSTAAVYTFKSFDL